MNDQVDINKQPEGGEKKVVGKNKKAPKKSSPSKKPGLNSKLLKESFSLLAPQANELVDNFYALLFERYPDVKPLFKNTTPEAQQKKLVSALIGVVSNSDKPETLKKILTEMGKRHQGYGALEPHYKAVSTTLIETMSVMAGDAWNQDYEDAWNSALALISKLMLSAYSSTEASTAKASKPEAETMAENNNKGEDMTTTNEQSEELVTSNNKTGELTMYQAAIAGITTPIILVDLDLVITYANQASIKLWEKYLDLYRGYFPGFDPYGTVGLCIDQFHTDARHQRALLADPSRLPYSTLIDVGEDGLKFRMTATSLMDEDGNHIGSTLEWSDETYIFRKEQEVVRLQSAIDGATSNLMICDNDLNIVYANPAVVGMMSNRTSELRQIFPGLDPANLVGTCIDGFHKNPAHQRSLLADASRLPATANIKLADLEFQVNATMITGPDGEYMGNMVEWKDITEQMDAERQIRELVEAASMGEFSSRIDTATYTGFFKQLGGLLNELMTTSERGLTDVVRVIKQLAEGDLTGSIEDEYHGLFGELKNDVNSTVENLQSMVEQIRDGAFNISTSASEISQGNTDLSQRTEEQASSLEETASSMEEMTSAVRSSADNARQANQLAAGAREQAESGGQVVAEAVQAMAAINNSSKQIAEIIGVIDEIAFQTNLLALNAAVEAARAGEQGRGFAVVASEVRNLAQRSAEAAKEIKSLIKDSAEKVDDGSRLVGDSGQTLEEIVTAVKKVSDIIAEIAAASQEQSAGIEQVNKAITQLDEVTQQNAALVEQAAASSESMDEQAKELSDLVEYFNTVDEEQEAPQLTKKPAKKSARKAPKAASARPATRAKKPAKVVGENAEEWEEF
jgi:methyl-accepting chemotaxis protein